MSKEMAEINVEELSCLILKHEVAWMSISDSKYICSNALTSQGMQEVHVILVKTLSD